MPNMGLMLQRLQLRVTASTRADLTGAIVSGIATLKGELHGGANERAVELINSFETVDDAEKELKSS